MASSHGKVDQQLLHARGATYMKKIINFRRIKFCQAKRKQIRNSGSCRKQTTGPDRDYSLIKIGSEQNTSEIFKN